MKTLMLIAMMLVPQALLAAGLDAPNEYKAVSLIGFSRTHKVSAWQVDVERASHGYTDKFQLVRIIETNSNDVVMTYATSNVRRVGRGGKAVAASKSALRAANPDWASAQPKAEWVALKAKHRFFKKKLTMHETTIRLLLDEDTNVEPKPESDTIVAHTWPGQPLGYQVVSRLASSGSAVIGHFRMDAVPERVIKTEIDAYISFDAMSLAVVSRFSVRHPTDFDNVSRPTYQAATFQVEKGDMIGHIGAGMTNLTFFALERSEQLFEEMHPNAAPLYEEFVGKYWNSKQ